MFLAMSCGSLFANRLSSLDGSVSADGRNLSRSTRKKASRGHRKLSARKKAKKSGRRIEDKSSDESAATDVSSASSGSVFVFSLFILYESADFIFNIRSAVDEDSDSEDV